MKTIYRFVSVAVIALGLASCNKGESTLALEQPADRLVSFVANTENSVDTKTSLSGNDKSGYRVLWSEGDRIILDNRAESRFYLLSGAGTTKGTFQGSYAMDEGSYDAYYTTASSIYSLSLPDETEYMAGNIISSTPMKGKLTFEGGSVSSEAEFKNLCGLLRLSLKGEGTVMKIMVYADQYLYGEFEVNEEGSAVINYKPEHDYITQYCREGVDLASDKGTDFYFPLPPNDYTGVKIEITDIYNNTCTKILKADKTLNIVRAKITPVNLSVSGLEKKPDIPAGSLLGEFTVDSEGRKVCFSKGNLYWDGDSFEFEENQDAHLSSWTDDHVDHFYWANEASAARNKTFNNPGFTSSDVFFTNATSETPKPDFTVNGVTGRYRTLSSAEWHYLFSNHRHKWVTVNGVGGIVIAPDDVDLKSSYSRDELASGNLVFLPAAGNVLNNGDYSEVGNQGEYWSSTASATADTDGKAYCIHYRNNGLELFENYRFLNHCTSGMSVRLVIDKE